MSRTFSLTATVIVGALVVFACQIENPTEPVTDSPELGKGHGYYPKMKICHADKHGWWHRYRSRGHRDRSKEHRYREVMIHAGQERWHRSHGDGKRGDYVPGKPGHVFGRHCKPVRAKASLTVIKNADAAGVFDFEGSPLLGEFQLATGDADLNVITFDDLDARIDFNILEIPQEGFTLVSATCTFEDGEETGYPDERGVTDIRLHPDETTTCVFVNEAVQTEPTGSLKVVKQSDVPGVFGFAGSPPIDVFSLDTGDPASAEQIFDGLDPLVTYSVSEDVSAEFTLTAVSCALEGGEATGVVDGLSISEIVVEAEKTTTCTFVNESVQVDPGTLRVTKTSDVPGVFDFTGSSTIGAFTLNTSDPGTSEQVFEGLDTQITYTVAEAANAEFNLTSAVCTLEGGATTGVADGLGVTDIVIEPGLTTTCEFVNTAIPAAGGSLNIVKTSDDPAVFNFEASPTIGSFTLDTGDPSTSGQVFDGLNTEVTYSVSEILGPDFLLISAMCNLQDGTPTGMRSANGVVNIVIQEGLTTDCSFVNVAVPQTGSLTIVKSSDVAGTFAFAGTPSIGTFTLAPTDTDPAETTFTGLDAQVTYAVTETANSAFTLEGASCTLADGTDTGTLEGTTVSGIQIQVGLTTTCTFDNAAVPTFGTLRVVASTDAPGIFDFQGEPDLGTFQLDTSLPTTSAQSFEITNVAVTYSITQTLHAVFDFIDAECTLEDGTVTGTLTDTTVSEIQVELGNTTTCTFINTSPPVTPPFRGG